MSNHIIFVFIGILFSITCSASALEVSKSRDGIAYISYDGEPAFGYGASPQHILTYLPSGNGNDYRAWVEWAHKYQMNHVRSYPPSIIVKAPSLNLFQNSEGNKFNLKNFNQAYFDELRRACQLMKEKGFFVHLQLWQSVAWKKHWRHNYYNPDNNVNPDISKHAGPGEFMGMTNPKLLAHQKEYVTKILNATADLGNVYFDIANEIGNGTDEDQKWVLEILNTMRQWEHANDHKLLVTINDEGGMRVTGIEEIFNRTDLIIKDLGRWDEHVNTQREYKKPTVSVRNIDWDYKKNKRRYFYGKNNLEINTDKDFQTRGRKYWWRMYMARVQMAAAYADAYNEENTFPGAHLVEEIFNLLDSSNPIPKKMASSYNLNTLTEDNFVYFRNFIRNIEDYPSLLPYDNIVDGHTAAHNYCLQSTNEVVVYLESPNGNAGYTYPETQVSLINLSLNDGIYSGLYYHPASGVEIKFKTLVTDGKALLTIPSFNDDIAIYIK